MARLAAFRGEQEPVRARSPVGELSRAVNDVLGSYFQSHPLSQDRTRRMAALIERTRERLTGRGWYIGRENLQRKTPRSHQEFLPERRRL